MCGLLPQSPDISTFPASPALGLRIYQSILTIMPLPTKRKWVASRYGGQTGRYVPDTSRSACDRAAAPTPPQSSHSGPDHEADSDDLEEDDDYDGQLDDDVVGYSDPNRPVRFQQVYLI